MEVNHAMAHRRPLSGEMAHHQEMVNNGTSRDPSRSHRGWDDVRELVGFVVRWDAILGITHQNRPQPHHRSSGNPLRHSSARVAHLSTMLSHRETISGARGWARGPRRQHAQPFSKAHRDQLR